MMDISKFEQALTNSIYSFTLIL